MRLCNYLLLFFLVLAHTTCIAAVHWDELSASSGDIDAFFPPKLAGILKRVADAKSIPYASLAAGMLLLTCVFSHASWTSGVAGQIEPLILHLKNVGLSGINKTGCFNYVNYIFHRSNQLPAALWESRSEMLRGKAVWKPQALHQCIVRRASANKVLF